MARKQIAPWTGQSAQSQDVWSSTSDRALHVWLRNSPVDRWGMSTSLIDRFLPVVTLGIVVISGLIIGWVLFAP